MRALKVDFTGCNEIMLLLHAATGASQPAGQVGRLLQQIWPFCSGRDEEKLQGPHVYFLRSIKKS